MRREPQSVQDYVEAMNWASAEASKALATPQGQLASGVVLGWLLSHGCYAPYDWVLLVRALALLLNAYTFLKGSSRFGLDRFRYSTLALPFLAVWAFRPFAAYWWADLTLALAFYGKTFITPTNEPAF
jgi:hypothetical protein